MSISGQPICGEVDVTVSILLPPKRAPPAENNTGRVRHDGHLARSCRWDRANGIAGAGWMGRLPCTATMAIDGASRYTVLCMHVWMEYEEQESLVGKTACLCSYLNARNSWILGILGYCSCKQISKLGPGQARDPGPVTRAMPGTGCFVPGVVMTLEPANFLEDLEWGASTCTGRHHNPMFNHRQGHQSWSWRVDAQHLPSRASRRATCSPSAAVQHDKRAALQPSI
jgi:hypothetical protein